PEYICSFLKREPNEVAQFYQFGFAQFELRKLFQRVAERQNRLVIRGERNFQSIERHRHSSSTAPSTFASSRPINQNATHRLRCAPKKMCGVLPERLPISTQPEPGFVNKGGGLKCLARWFLGHLRRSESPQFTVHQAEELLRRIRVARMDLLQNQRQLA